MITSLEEIKRTREKVMRRQAILLDALEEYNRAVDKALREARAESRSIRLKVIETKDLLEVSRSTVYRMGANHCKTYAELWAWVREHKPEFLGTLEKNFEEFLRKR